MLHVQGEERFELAVVDAQNFIQMIFDKTVACRPVAEINKGLKEREREKWFSITATNINPCVIMKDFNSW